MGEGLCCSSQGTLVGLVLPVLPAGVLCGLCAHPFEQYWVLQPGPVPPAAAVVWWCVELEGEPRQQLVVLQHSLTPGPEGNSNTHSYVLDSYWQSTY